MTNDNTSRNINDEETTIRQDIKNKNIASVCMLNIVLLLSLFVISTPNNSINSTTYNCTNINFTDINYNISVACNCIHDVKYTNYIRYTYNIFGIGIMFIMIFTLKTIYTRYSKFSLIFYYILNLVILIAVQIKLRNYNSFCFIGLYKYNSTFIINFLFAFWSVMFITVVFIIKLISISINDSNILLCSYFVTRPNRTYNPIRINTSDTLPLYTEHPIYTDKPPRYE